MSRVGPPAAESIRAMPCRTVERGTVLLVDEYDRVIGQHAKLEAHRLGMLHSAFSIFVFRSRAGARELLLQKRAAAKYQCAGLWSNTCCSHPGPGELLRDSAVDRLREEMGFRVPLSWLGRHTYRAVLDNSLIEHEIDHLFVGWHNGEVIDPHPGEVEDWYWIRIPDLLEHLAASSDVYTPWLSGTLAKVLARCPIREG